MICLDCGGLAAIVLRVLNAGISFREDLHRLAGFGEAAEGAEAEGGFVQQPGLVGFAQIRRQTNDHGESKNDAIAPRSEPKAPSLGANVLYASCTAASGCDRASY